MNKALDHLNPRDALRMHLCCNEKTKKNKYGLKLSNNHGHSIETQMILLPISQT